MGNPVYIFDTTLRDGEQSPGVALNIHEKLQIAHQLADLGVDIIEAGFPVASPGDFESVRAIAKEVRGPVIAGLARIGIADIDRAWEAVQFADKPRLHTFVATSEIHLNYKLRMTREQVLDAIHLGVSRAKKYCDNVEFSPEDGFRSDREFLIQTVQTAIDAGAVVINIPDTVGYATPAEYGNMFAEVISKLKNAEHIIFSAHCHNDLGMAVANTLASIENGVRQVECAVNGIGERAGNTALEEVVMALRTRKDFYHLETGIVTEEIYRTSRLVSSLTGMVIQPNKAVVGKNAFQHESGIHQDGVLKERTTYEIMNPTMIGLIQNNIVLGKHSGRHAVKQRLQELGYTITEEQLSRAFQRFKELADRKRDITDRDLEAIMEDERKAVPERYQLEYLQVSSGTRTVPTATVGVREGDTVQEEAAVGDGPVEAIFNAMDKISGLKPCLKHYAINAVTGGKDAMGEVTVQVEHEGRVYVGRGLSVDVLEASGRSYINAVNKIFFEMEPVSVTG